MKTFLVTYSITKNSQTITEGIKADDKEEAEILIKCRYNKAVIYGIAERKKQSYTLPAVNL